MSSDIKLSKSLLSKIIQSGGFLGKTLGSVKGNLGKKATNRPRCSFGYKCFA